MPLLHVDALGLTTSGAVLGFAPVSDSPVLIDSALGRVTLYFRDAAGDFLLAYYDTLTGRARLHLPAAVGEVTFVARATAGELDGLTVTLSAADTDTTCTLAASLPGAVAVTETWTGLPVDAASLAAIVNGTTQPVFVGSVKAATGQARHVDAHRAVAAARAGRLGGAGRVRAFHHDPGCGPGGDVGGRPTPRPPAQQRRPPGRAEFRSHRARGRPALPARLRLRVGHVDPARCRPEPRLAAHRYRRPRGRRCDNRSDRRSLLVRPPSCQWFAAPPGTTVDFDGTTTHAGVLANTAVRLDGKSGFTLGQHAELDITGTVTLEAWVRLAVRAPGADEHRRAWLLAGPRR